MLTRAVLLLLHLTASPVFWFGFSAGLCVAAAILAGLTLLDAARERRERRAARYQGRRRAVRRPAVRASRTGDTQPLPAVRPPSPHGSARPVPPWVGRSERPGLMARLGGWHR